MARPQPRVAPATRATRPASGWSEAIMDWILHGHGLEGTAGPSNDQVRFEGSG